MALKEAARSWMMNLPKESIASWGELCEQFVANFRGAYECPCTKNNLHAMVQRPKETLRKFIQHFSQARNKIPCITNAEIISAFSTGVTDIRMCEKLGIRDNLASAVELFEMVDKCAKAEEGRLFGHNVPNADTDAALTKGKGASKRKPPAVLAGASLPNRKARLSSSQGATGLSPSAVTRRPWLAPSSTLTERLLLLTPLVRMMRGRSTSHQGRSHSSPPRGQPQSRSL
jgi:hypothetical protein